MNLALLEKNLANTDLNKYKTVPIDELVKQLYKYQKFNIKTIAKKINYNGYSINTIINYHNAIRKYITKNIKISTSATLYEIVDKLVLTCCPILTPSKSDAIKIYKRKNESEQPKAPEIIEVEVKRKDVPVENEQVGTYGVKIGNTITVLESKEHCLGYIECYKTWINSKDVSIVSLSLKEVE